MRTFLRRRAVAACAVLCLALLGGCDPLPSEDIPSLRGTKRVLFIGNSHSYVNDLPTMLVRLARLAGDSELEAAEVAYANYALEDHLIRGTAPEALRRSSWEFVVLQQGTSALPASQLHLRTGALAFQRLIAEAGAEPVLYQIWPSLSRRFDAAQALVSYHNAAFAIEGILAPVGDAFTVALDETDPALPVYSGDGLHASVYGSYVAALVLLQRISGVDPESLPPRIPGRTDDEATVRALQRAAATALARNPTRPTALHPETL